MGHERAVVGVASIAAVLLIWQLAATIGILSELFFSSPLGILRAAIAEVQLSRFWSDFGTTLFEFLGGYLAAVLLAVPAGILLGWYRRLGYLFEPSINFLYVMPEVALLPLIFLSLGITIWSKVAISFLVTWVIVVITMIRGVRAVEQRWITVAASFGASDLRIFWTVIVPGSVPFILSALRLGIGRALIGVIVAELYGASAGLGFMIHVASDNLQAGRVFFATFLFAGVGLAAVAGMRALERRAVPWRAGITISR